jgi:hypothetical protein
MLKQLDVLIGFAVVMSVVSLMITIMTQMVSSLLGLRGMNLADALETMIDQIDPGFAGEGDTKMKGLAKELVDKILTNPLISDSTLSMTKKRTFERLFNIWKRASAIRPDEFLDMVRQLAGLAEGELIDLKALGDAKTEYETANSAANQTKGIPDIDEKEGIAKETGIKFAAAKLLYAAQQASKTTVAEHGDANTKLEQLKQDIAGKTAALAQLKVLASQPIAAGSLSATSLILAKTEAELEQAKTKLEQFEQTAEQLAKNVAAKASEHMEKWFNSAQDRAQQWFAMHTRVWTVIWGVFMAFLLQLDTFQLFRQLSTDSDLRSKLVNYSQDTLQKKAGEVFTNTLSLAAINREAINQLRASHKIPPSSPEGPALPEHLDIGVDVESWLANQAGTNSDAILKEFREIESGLAKTNYDRASKDLSDLTDSFSKTGFQLMPDPYPPFFKEEFKSWNRPWDRPWTWPWHWPWSGLWSWPKLHLLGILATAALLSLGAPFWFNQLKVMSSLRPAIAQNIDQERSRKGNDTKNAKPDN